MIPHQKFQEIFSNILALNRFTYYDKSIIANVIAHINYNIVKHQRFSDKNKNLCVHHPHFSPQIRFSSTLYKIWIGFANLII